MGKNKSNHRPQTEYSRRMSVLKKVDNLLKPTSGNKEKK